MKLNLIIKTRCLISGMTFLLVLIVFSLLVAGCKSTTDETTPDTTAPTTSAQPAGGIYNATQSVNLTCDDGDGGGCGNGFSSWNQTTKKRGC